MKYQRLIFILFFLLTIAPKNSAQAYVKSIPSGNEWIIGNSFLERKICFYADTGLITTSILNKLNARELCNLPSKFLEQGNQSHAGEFSFQANGEYFDGRGTNVALVGSRTEDIPDRGKKLTIILKTKRLALNVEVNYEIFDSFPAMRKWISIRNNGEKDLSIDHLSFDDGKIFICPSSRLEVNAMYGIQPREIFYTGRAEDCVICERDASSGTGVFFLNEAPGFLKRTEVNQWWNSFGSNSYRMMYDTDLFPFSRFLSPGETFNSSGGSLIITEDGNGYSDPRWALPGYTSHVLSRQSIAYKPEWIYNTWEPFWRNINEKIVIDLITIAHKMGFDIFTIDDAWQKDYGSNEIDTSRFPGGLDRIRDILEEKGMKLGLWVPMASVVIKTVDAIAHPEWICREQDGKEKTTGTADGTKAVMCLATPYRKLAAKRISDLITRYHLKYVKLDLTTIFNAYGESPGCYATGHDHHDWKESLCRIYEGINEVTSMVYKDHPDVLLDLTFELWGEKHIIDYGLIRAGDLDWLSNVDDFFDYSAGPRQARTLLYQRSLAVPVETMLIGNLQAQTGSIEEKFATAIGSSPLLLGDLRKLSPEQINWYHEKIAWFKNLRRELKLNESFFPMGSWRQPNSEAWDGFARLDPSGEGIAVMFRNECRLNTFLLQIPSIPAGNFVLKSVITGKLSKPHTSAELQKGISLIFPDQHPVEIFEIRLQK
jgi:alpha-galactosidase